MQRRNFLVGVGGAAIGGSALLGSGAFTRVESHRSVTVAVANDAEAYLGMSPLDSLNSQNYVTLDENGHIYIQIDGEGNQQGIDGNDGPIGQGVNSDSFTYFDGMFELCNNGKDDAFISYALPEDVVMNEDDEPAVAFYYVTDDGDRRVIEAGEELLLEVGECDVIGVVTRTKGVDASVGELIDGDVVITADAPGAGEVGNGNGNGSNGNDSLNGSS